MNSIEYRPEIDGLRAFAVIVVILFHCGVGWMPGGFVGVDVFFVISGYLITSIILHGIDHGTFKLTGFWMKRVRRIAPALLATLITTSVAGFFILYGPDMHNLGRQGLAALLSYANVFLLISSGSYWGAAAENSPFLHTWSLSLEEQFYLVFPILLFLLARFFRKGVAAILACLVVASFAMFAYGTKHHPSATFYLLPTRAWELGSGCLLAAATCGSRWTAATFRKSRIAALLSFFGLALVALACLLFTKKEGLSPYLLVPVLGSVLVIAFSNNATGFAGKALTIPPVVYTGKISYSLYLWHWPVIFMSNCIYSNGMPLLKPLYSLPLIAVLSIASYHGIEQPFRRRGSRLYPVIFMFVVSMALSVFLSTSDRTEDISAFSETTWYGELYDLAPDSAWPDEVVKKMEGIDIPFRDPSYDNAYAESGIVRTFDQQTPEVVVLGDSHACSLGRTIDDIVGELQVSTCFYMANGGPIFFDIPVRETYGKGFFNTNQRYVYETARFRALTKWTPKVVIIAAQWSTFENTANMQDLIHFLGSIGSRVLLVEQAPELFFGDRNAPRYLSYMKMLPQANARRYVRSASGTGYENGRHLLRELAAKFSYCQVVPVADIFLKGNDVWVLDGTDVLYIDEDHLSQQGALKVKSRIKQYLEAALNPDAPAPTP
ncbi:MAG: acyltransferase [Kiritimatiellales bacterium]|nr:acyltransferase [Kiritimatiellales bacterium]